VQRQRGLDAGTQRLLYIAGGLTGALVLIVLLWSSVGHHSGGAVPVVQADQRPVRVKPVNPGGMQIPGLNAEVAAADGGAGDQLAPAPETPDPAALAKQMPAPVAAPVPAPAAMAPPAAAHAAPLAATSVPAQPPMPAQPNVLPAQAAPEHRLAKAEPAPLAGHQAVQLAALTSEAAARQEWDRLGRKMPGLFAGHRPLITKFDHDGRTLWRLRTAGFTTEAAARQFCQDLHAKGAGCAVASF
jgi:hypothetical protein